ncbi:DUF5305 domain-containing protein [Dehalobacter sp. DCM]|uniref:DUF5305 family protein n=1 Tax=Dehalobacter sp. DCM TaxID=2907827 RepID=UPI00308215A0|nr:DUF5305 domain-containing protein [Dehalobacter sp. DCM]
MRKKTINRNIRLALIAVIICSLLATAVILYQKITRPDMEEQKTTYYSYTNKLDVGYEVSLKPNHLFDQVIQGEDKVYISNLVDAITASFSYQFIGDSQAEIKGNYDIVAVMEGYTLQNQQRISIWKKQFTLVPQTSFETKDKKISIDRNVVLNFQDYRDFAGTIKEETKIDSDVTLTAYMTVRTQSLVEKGSVNESISSSIALPVKGSYFEISKKSEDKPGAIQEVTQVPVKNSTIISITVILMVVFLSALLGLIFYTTNRNEDRLLKKLKGILKKYGNRMAALNMEIIPQGESFEVRSFEDLVTFSDEIGRPIVYKHCDDMRRISAFYVLDGKWTYCFFLKN